MWQLAPLPRTLEAAVRDLADPSPKVRISAIGDLARFVEGDDHARVVHALLGALGDDAGDVRAHAASALGDVGASEALPRLLVMIEDPHPLARQLAIGAVGALADPRGGERLRRALDDDRPEVRFQAVIAFPRVMPAEADQELARATGDEDGAVRYIALRVAEERFEESPGALAPALAEAARARLADARAEVRVAAALLLAAAGSDDGREVLISVAEDHVRTPEAEDEAAALEAAGKLRLEGARAGLARRAWGVARLFREQHGIHAKIGLALLGDARARREIVEDLEAWSLVRRTAAAMAVGKARLVEGKPALEAMRGRPDRADPAVVEDALRALERTIVPGLP